MAGIKIIADFNFKDFERRVQEFIKDKAQYKLHYSTAYIPGVSASRANPMGLKVQYSVLIEWGFGDDTINIKTDLKLENIGGSN